MLQSLGDLALSRVDAGLLQDARRVDTGLREQVPESGVFRLKRRFFEALGVGWHQLT